MAQAMGLDTEGEVNDSNFEKVRCNTSLSILALMDEEKDHSSRFHFGGSASLWYQRFGIGCRARMGQDVRQDLALITNLWVVSIEQCGQRARDSHSFGEGAGWSMVGAYLIFVYVLSLRGP
jgi:hypothetical protein